MTVPPQLHRGQTPSSNLVNEGLANLVWEVWDNRSIDDQVVW